MRASSHGRRIRLWWFVAALAALVGLVGCGSTGLPPAQPSPPPRPSPPPATTPVPSPTASASATPSTSPAAPGSGGLVVGLGDSVTAGSACACRPFVEEYAELLSARGGAAWTAANFGKGGLTTTGLAAQLAAPATRAQLAHADTVVVTIGANDLNPLVDHWKSGGCTGSCVTTPARAMGTELTTVLGRLRGATPKSARVLVTTYWNVFEDGDVADQLHGRSFAGWSDGVTREANAAICQAAERTSSTCVDLYTPFEGAGDRNPTALLADDGDHPNAAGHRLIAQTLLAVAS